MTPNRLIFASFALLLACLTACDPDEGGGGGAAGGGDAGAAGSGGGAGGSASGNECDPPTGAEIVMPWQKVTPADPTGSPTPAYGLATGGGELYANFFDKIVKLPLAGGAVSDAYKSSESIPLGFRSFQDDSGMLVLEMGKWVRVPFGGGAAQPLSVPLPTGAEVFSLDPATDTVWASASDFSTQKVTVVKAAFGAATADTVIAAQATGYTERWHRSGDRYFTEGANDADGTRAIFVAQAGGAPAPFPVTPPSARVLGVTGASLFYLANSFDSAVAGVYRVPVAGGAPTRVYKEYTPVGIDRWVVADAIYLNDANHLLKFSDTQDGKRIAPVPTGACTTHTVMPHDGYVYTVTFKSKEGENQIWRIKE